MSDPSYELERLISRHLDDECTPQQRHDLNARLRHDPHAVALFEEHAALDREIKRALRRVLDHSPRRHHPSPLWKRAARAVVVAAAACIAAMIWFSPHQNASSPARQAATQGSSWFASPPTTGAGDTLVEQSDPFGRPRMRTGRPNTDWIVIPSDTPGEFLVIQIDRPAKKTASQQADF
jgi:anti-sigma factor RsiW